MVLNGRLGIPKVSLVITLTYSCLSLKITVRGNHQKFKIPPPYMTYFDPKLEILTSKNSVRYTFFGVLWGSMGFYKVLLGSMGLYWVL